MTRAARGAVRVTVLDKAPAVGGHLRVGEVVGADAKVSQAEPAKPAAQIPGMPTGEEGSNVSDTEADEMEEHLPGLGYIE